jgi:alkylhydroperoxidase family enzyme
MTLNKLPAARLSPVPKNPELDDTFARFENAIGFLPNSVLIMQRKPRVTEAFSMLVAAVWEQSTIDRGFKRLIGHVASRGAGCQYCMAHTAGAALRNGLEEQKLQQVCDFRASPIFNAAERAALEVALAAGSQPNTVTDELFENLKEFWTETEIVEIVSIISLFGFLNRFNDTMATPLEAEVISIGEKHLSHQGWGVGRHARRLE